MATTKSIGKSISLYFKSGSSDKEYHAQIVEADGGFQVVFQYGRRGSALTSGTHKDTKSPVTLEKAEKVWDKLVKSKLAKGYTEGEAGTPFTGTTNEKKVTGMVPQLLNSIKEEDVEKYLSDNEWGAQEKKDGRHVMIRCKGGKITAANRKGLEIPLPKNVADSIFDDCELDGEMIADIYHAFDLVGPGTALERHKKLWTMEFGASPSIRVVPMAVTKKDKRALYARLKKQKKEGIVFKRLSSKYTPGRPNSGGDMLKFKFWATCSCLVSEHDGTKRSVPLRVLKGSLWVAVGNVTIPPNVPLPWAGTVVEVRYLYAFEEGSLFQPVYLRTRDDVNPKSCTIQQLKYKVAEE